MAQREFRTLGGLAHAGETELQVTCVRCQHRGRFRLSVLLLEHGPDLDIRTLGQLVRLDCPNQDAMSPDERCSFRYPQLPRFW